MRELIQCVQVDNANESIKDTIYAIKNAGFDGVFLQWYNKNLSFSQIEQLKLCKTLDLKIEFCHLGYKGINNIWIDGENGDLLVKEYLKDIQTLSEFGIKMIVMHLTSHSIAPAPNQIGLERIKKIATFAKSKNIKIAFENTKTYGYLEYVFDNLNFDNIGLCFDSGHYHCHFNDKFNFERFKNKIFAIHLHNNDKTSDQHYLPFDERGTIDWKKLINSLKNANYNGPITLESLYKNHYTEKSLNEFYDESFNQAKKLREMFLI